MNLLPTDFATSFLKRKVDLASDNYKKEEIDDRDIAEIHDCIKLRRATRHGFASRDTSSYYSPSLADKDIERGGYESASSWSYLSSHHSPATLGDSWDEIDDGDASSPSTLLARDQSINTLSSHLPIASMNHRTNSSVHPPSESILQSHNPASEFVSDADDEQSSAFEEVADDHLDVSAIRRRKLEERQRGKVDEELRTSLSTLLMLRNATRTASKNDCTNPNTVDESFDPTMYSPFQSQCRYTPDQSNYHSLYSSNSLHAFDSRNKYSRSSLSMTDFHDSFLYPIDTSEIRNTSSSSLKELQLPPSVNYAYSQGEYMPKNRPGALRKVSDKSHSPLSNSISSKADRSKYSPYSVSQDLVNSSDDESDDDIRRRTCLGKRRKSNSSSLLSSTPPTVISTQNTSRKWQYHEGRQVISRKKPSVDRSTPVRQPEISETDSVSVTDVPTSLYSSLTATGLDSGDAGADSSEFRRPKKNKCDDDSQCSSKSSHSFSSEPWTWFATFFKTHSILSTSINSWHWIGLGFAVIAAFSTGCIMTMPRPLRSYTLFP